MASVQNNNQVTTTENYAEQLRAKGLNEGRIKMLDEIDGNDKDGIQKSVFDVASAIMDGMTRNEAVEKFGEDLCNQVGQVMDLRNSNEDPTQGLPMYIKPEDAMRDLGITARQSGELAKLNNKNPEKGIQRGFYQIAEAIVNGKEIIDPSGMLTKRVEAVAKILRNED